MVSRDADKPASAGSVLMDRMLSFTRQPSGEQEKRGDRLLDEAQALIAENRLVINSADLGVIEDKIAV